MKEKSRKKSEENNLPVDGAGAPLGNDRADLDVRPGDDPFGVDFRRFVFALLFLELDDTRLAVARRRRRRRSFESQQTGFAHVNCQVLLLLDIWRRWWRRRCRGEGGGRGHGR